MNYLIYARVSPKGSDFDRETTIQMQVDLCREYVRSISGTVVEVLTDEFLSGKDTERPAFKKMMADMESGRAEWDCVCVYKLSRLTRSLKDGADIFEKFYKWGKGFVSITERNLDFSTPSGRAMLGILQVFNQFEREQVAENTRNKMISIAAGGGWPCGCPPAGYKRGAKHDNKLYIEPRAAEMIKTIFVEYAGDVPLFKICKKFGKGPQTILHYLRNKIYLGKIVYADQEYQGLHEPIISQQLFDKVQAMLPQQMPDGKKSHRPKMQKYPYLLAGVLHCHCGRFMTPESSKSGDYHYYRCTDNVKCKNRLNARKIENDVMDNLSMPISQSFTKGAMDELKKARNKYLDDVKPELENATKALAAAQKEQEKIYNLFLTGSVKESNADFFNNKLKQVSGEIESLSAKIEYLRAQINNADNSIPDIVERIISEMQSTTQILKEAGKDPAIRRQLVDTYIKTVEALPDGSFNINFIYKEIGTSTKKSGCPARI